MSVTTKLSLRGPAGPIGHPESRRDEGSPSISPQELLDSLKAKQNLYEKLKTEGLIHQNKHLGMETKLRETIAELEILIPKLEASENGS